MIDKNQTAWFIYTLTGAVDSVVSWRCIHDQRKDLPAHNYHGTIDQMWETLTDYNQRGYGIFCNINGTDGQGQHLDNITHIRAHVVDLDNPLTAQANYERAAQSGATLAVQSSPGKYHIYWVVEPYVGNDFYTAHQRKLAQLYNGDKSIIDATRVMRVPGFIHAKGEPKAVTCWPLDNVAHRWTAAQIEKSLEHVNVLDFIATRSPLGTPEMSAPDLEWLRLSLTLIDPNEMTRAEWLSFSAAFKQAGWLHADDESLYGIWQEWCNQYTANDEGENRKLWDSIRDTEVGWTSIERRVPTLKAYKTFGFKSDNLPATVTTDAPVNTAIMTQPDQYGEIMSVNDCREWFKDCYFVNRVGQIFSQAGRFMNSTQFNGRYGGKQFIISSTGKLTDEPWKAALRSTVWQIPKVDHVRFLPDRPTFEIVNDGLGRPGLNTYIPARIDAREGDLTLWFDWFDKIFPDKTDQRLIFEYMAHCVKFPGFKIPWAPLIQSTEGIGKTIFKEVMAHALGDMYVYSPKAPELVKSGSTFNAWQRGKLMILVDEIKIDERRELIEILKPMITDNRVEIQSKGVDQEMEDNPANWLFFSNFKDAIPISKNGRRYAIFYSALQSKVDIVNAGMDGAFFQRLWGWLRDGGGLQAITYWLLNYPIERGAIDVRAPDTSSQREALDISQSPMEVVINDCVSDGVSGFRGGYVSTLAVLRRAKEAGIRNVTTRSARACLETLGFIHIGRALRPYIQEDVNNRAEIYATASNMTVDGYATAQGYE